MRPIGDQPGHQLQRESLGAFVLGHLDEAEERQVREHLATCAACRTEVDDLSPVATALETLRQGSRVDTPPEPAADLGRRVEQRIWAERRRDVLGRTARTAAVAMLAAAAAAVVLVAGLRLTGPSEPEVSLEAVQVAEQVAGVEASAGLVAHSWGVEVKLVATGLDEGGRFDVDVVGTDGTVYPAGAFVGTGAAEMACNLNAGVLRDLAASFIVRNEGGVVVLTSQFPA